MKVLFVSSGRNGCVSELIRNQGESLIVAGLDVQYFIFKSGVVGYFIGISKLRKLIKNSKFDLIHAHYSLSAFAATFSGKIPLVVSLLGSDAFKSSHIRWITRLFHYYFWSATIVKTNQMIDMLKLKKAVIIPNGVDVIRFQPMSKIVAREKINFHGDKKLILFLADPSRSEKNYTLAVSAVKSMENDNVELMPVFNVSNEEIPYYINAADALLLTSKREGSVNVVKEAMACNIPIVSTDVGDVKENTKGLTGCFICNADPESLAEGLRNALELKESTNSRDRIIELNLDSDAAAKKIISIYKQVLSNER